MIKLTSQSHCLLIFGELGFLNWRLFIPQGRLLDTVCPWVVFTIPNNSLCRASLIVILFRCCASGGKLLQVLKWGHFILSKKPVVSSQAYPSFVFFYVQVMCLVQWPSCRWLVSYKSLEYSLLCWENMKMCPVDCSDIHPCFLVVWWPFKCEWMVQVYRWTLFAPEKWWWLM